MEKPVELKCPIPTPVRWDNLSRNNGVDETLAPLIKNHEAPLSLNVEDVEKLLPSSTFIFLAESEESCLRKTFLMDKAFEEGRNQTLAALSQCHAINLNRHFPPKESAQPLATDKSVSLPQACKSGQNTTNKHTEKQINDLDWPMYLALRRNKCNRKYIDVSSWDDPVGMCGIRGGVIDPFPEKLHRMLCDVEMNGRDGIVSFFLHGRAFSVNNRERFVEEILPKYLGLNRFSSFQRQLNLYGFVRIRSGLDKGGYYHELFLKGRPLLCSYMRRVKNVTSIIQNETSRRSKAPDFYRMKPCLLQIKDPTHKDDGNVIDQEISDVVEKKIC
jgi:HSF-type DNA-binding